MQSSIIFSIFVLLIFSLGIDAGSDARCWAVNGRCQYTSEACDGYATGMCAGPYNRQCCVKGADRKCTERYLTGACQDTNKACWMGYVSNLCGGGNNRKCCKGFGI